MKGLHAVRNHSFTHINIYLSTYLQFTSISFQILV